MASLTIYKWYQNNTELTNTAMKWVGVVTGYAGAYFGCVYKFTPDVKAKKLSFSLAFTSVSNDRRIYYKVSSSPAYNYTSQGASYFTTNRDIHGNVRQDLTASFEVEGTFESGTPYYLFLQSYYAGDAGYLDDISGTVTYTKAAPPIQYYDGNEWQPISALQYYNSSNQWADLTVAEYYNTNWVSTS